MTTEMNQEIKPLTAEDLDGIRDRWTVRGRYYLAQCEGCGYTGSSEGFHSDGEDIRCPRCRQERVAEVSPDAYPVVALLATIEAKDRERDTYAEQLAGTLALLSETRRALAGLRATVGGYLVCLSSGTADKGTLRTAYGISEIAISLTAPEALRKQEDMRRIAAAALKVATWKWTCPHPPAVQSGGVCRQCQDLRYLESALLPLMDTDPKGGQA